MESVREFYLCIIYASIPYLCLFVKLSSRSNGINFNLGLHFMSLFVCESSDCSGEDI